MAASLWALWCILLHAPARRDSVFLFFFFLTKNWLLHIHLKFSLSSLFLLDHVKNMTKIHKQPGCSNRIGSPSLPSKLGWSNCHNPELNPYTIGLPLNRLQTATTLYWSIVIAFNRPNASLGLIHRNTSIPHLTLGIIFKFNLF